MLSNKEGKNIVLSCAVRAGPYPTIRHAELQYRLHSVKKIEIRRIRTFLKWNWPDTGTDDECQMIDKTLMYIICAFYLTVNDFSAFDGRLHGFSYHNPCLSP